MYTRCAVVGGQHEAYEYFLFEHLQARWDESVHARRIARVIRSTPGHECIPKNDICLRYRVPTDLLSNELRHLERVGQKVILPVGTRWDLSPRMTNIGNSTNVNSVELGIVPQSECSCLYPP